ncbi:MAG: 4-aminobutyrate--2-oxoglutarate transaminase [Gammaproteobacteria bacterium]|nr:4-aminobutyrate--2-oxoglutarate transaminase [Gammaproteobacteria bacterium]
MTTPVDLAQRRQHAVARGVATATPVFASRAENAEIWDSEGRRYIDFASGIGVLATGHRHPRVMEAVLRQLDCFTHTAFQVMAYEPYVALAERLNALAPFRGPAKTVFQTTGAEAVENAVKIARVATGRPAVIAFSGAFHGRTQLTATLTGKISPYKRGVPAAVADVFRLPFPREHLGVTVADTLRALEELFHADVEPSRVAAILIEPVQGEGGFHVAPRELLAVLRRICDQHGIVLIADEVQSGFGRTGKLFAIEHFGVEPDLVTVAKSLAGGFPLSGVIGRADLIDRVEPGGLGGTYGGSPIGCAAALAVLDVVEQEGLLARAEALGARIRSRIAGFTADARLQSIDHLRGLGAMLAFDVVPAGSGDEPDGAAAKRVTRLAFEHGLVILTCGAHGETIRVLVPLTVPDEVLEEGLDILGQALQLARSNP